MFRNIIFDIGNVLLDFKPEEYTRSKVSDEQKAMAVCSSIFRSKEWLMLDRGTITEEEAICSIISRDAEYEGLIRLAFDNWYEMLKPIEGTVDIVRELKSLKYGVYYLSNFHHLAFENIIGRYDFFGLFNGGVVSYQEKLLKPEEDIYKRILNKYALRPEETIFIDDTPVNIEGAGRVGINTICFESPAKLREELNRHNILR